MHCTINVAMMSDCTKVEHRFGARRLAQLTGRYLAQIMMKKQSSVNGCVRRLLHFFHFCSVSVEKCAP